VAYSNDVLRYNSHGKEYEVPRVRVYSIYDLQRGDHIAFHQFWGAYWHHAIVERIDVDRDNVHVIEYSSTGTGSSADNSSSPKRPGKAKVMENTLTFQDITVYRLIHEQCLDPDTVVWRAKNEVGKGKYNLFTNNCEHFAMWCKTGRSNSDQVEKAKGMLAKGGATQAVSRVGSEYVRAGAGMAAKAAATRAASQARSGYVRAGAGMAVKAAATRATSQAGSEYVRAGVGMAAKAAATRPSSQAGSGYVKAGAGMAAKAAAIRAAS